MNSRTTDAHELRPSAARVSARSRFSAPPSTAFSGGAGGASPYDYGAGSTSLDSSASSTKSTSKSKGGINGNGRRTYDDGDDEAGSVGGLSSRSALRSAAAKRSAASSASGAGQRSGSSAAAAASGGSGGVVVNKDRPWRSASNSSAASSTAGTGTASYATTTAHEEDSDDGNNSNGGDLAAGYDATARSRSNNSTSSHGSRGSSRGSSSAPVGVSANSSDRWSQYDTPDLEEESRRATSNAVVDVATRMAERMVAEDDVRTAVDRARSRVIDEGAAAVVEVVEEGEEEGEERMMIPSAPMGGSAGTGYRDDPWAEAKAAPHAALESNGNSLPSNLPKVSTGRKSSSSKDYVKSRLSSLVPHRDARERNPDSYERSLSDSATKRKRRQAEHDKVRDEALKMLQIADSCLSDSPRNSRPSSPSSPRSSITAGLFRTAAGGLAMRELHNDEIDQISTSTTKREKSTTTASSIRGLDKFKSSDAAERSSAQSTIGRFDGTFAIGSHDEEDLKNYNSNNGNPASPNEDTPSLWSSRYSVERQLMAITGGLDSTHMLAKMDALHASREKTKSARGMYRASGYAMDGSHEEYGDYTGASSYAGLGGIWLRLRGTLWSDDPELNHDGTTQSLVRKERAIQKRRRNRMIALFLAALAIAVGMLSHKIRHPHAFGGAAAASNGGEDVNFYVLADEPFDFYDAERVTRELESLPPDAEFVVHLGNANGDPQSRCEEYGYERAAAVLRESAVPVLAIPGDLDWASCGSRRKSEDALRYWDINLGRFERNWGDNNPLGVEYSDDVVGNFAFMHKGVLFVGVSMVDAYTDPDEVTSRLEQNVMWTKGKLEAFDDDEYHAVVIFGHAPPSSKQEEYFLPVIDRIKDLDKPVLYMHANSDGSFAQYTPFNEAGNFEAVQLEKGGREAPMKVMVMGEERRRKEDAAGLFVFERRDPTVERTEK